MPEPIAFIGARPEKLAKISPQRLEHFTQIATYVARAGHPVHTGAAPGCDQIAAETALRAGGSVVLFLPWPSFERDWIQGLREHRGRVSVCMYDPLIHSQWNAWVDEHHPNPRALGPAARKLMCRNGGIIERASEVVALPLQEKGRAGGTGYGMDLATALGIPVWNLAEETARVEWVRRMTG